MTNAEKFIEVFGAELPPRVYTTKSWWEQEYIPNKAESEDEDETDDRK